MSEPLWQKLVEIKIRLENLEMFLEGARGETAKAVIELKSIWRQVEHLENHPKKDETS